MVNVATTYMIQYQLNPKIMMVVCGVGIMLIFLYLAYFQLVYQPYYSKPINNYRFAVYFTMGFYSMFGNTIDFLKINSYQFISDFAPILLVILFISGYYINSYYHDKSLIRIYSNMSKKQIIDKLNNDTSNGQLFFISDNNRKDIYRSVERISNNNNKYIYIFK